MPENCFGVVGRRRNAVVHGKRESDDFEYGDGYVQRKDSKKTRFATDIQVHCKFRLSKFLLFYSDFLQIEVLSHRYSSMKRRLWGPTPSIISAWTVIVTVSHYPHDEAAPPPPLSHSLLRRSSNDETASLQRRMTFHRRLYRSIWPRSEREHHRR